MHLIQPAAAALALSVAAVAATTIPISVGESGLTFTPDAVTAQIGDTLEFHFFAKNHSVVQGSWTSGCAPVSEGGFFSGFVPVASGESTTIFSVTLSSASPVVFYCSAGTHCQHGMFGVVNAVNDRTALASYGSLASNASTNVSPPAVFGGVLGTAVLSSSSSSLSTATPTVTSSAPTSTTTPKSCPAKRN